MRRNNNKRLYESIIKDVAKTVKKHLNEVSKDLVNRSIASAETRLKDPTINTKIRKGLKKQINTFNDYKLKNFSYEDDFNMLVDAVTFFYKNLDSPGVESTLIDDEGYDYDEIAETLYDINWDNIKNIMQILYKTIPTEYDWSDSIASILEYLGLVYLSITEDANWYDWSWAEEPYPDDDFEDYGEVLQDIEYNKKYNKLIVKLFNEFPEPLLTFICQNIMGFFYEDEDIYGL